MADDQRRTQIGYSVTEAAAMTGLSVEAIRRAYRAGDLGTARPRINGKPITKPVVITHEELVRWLHDAPTAADPA